MLQITSCCRCPGSAQHHASLGWICHFTRLLSAALQEELCKVRQQGLASYFWTYRWQNVFFKSSLLSQTTCIWNSVPDAFAIYSVCLILWCPQSKAASLERPRRTQKSSDVCLAKFEKDPIKKTKNKPNRKEHPPQPLCLRGVLATCRYQEECFITYKSAFRKRFHLLPLMYPCLRTKMGQGIPLLHRHTAVRGVWLIWGLRK